MIPTTYVSTTHYHSMISPFPSQTSFFVSSEFLKRRLLKRSSAHRMKCARPREANLWAAAAGREEADARLSLLPLSRCYY